MTDPTPDAVPHPLADEPLFKETQKIIRGNVRRQGELAQQGLNLNTDDLIARRLEMLVDHLLPSESMERVEFEHKWASLVSRSLDDAESALARARLQGHVPPAARGGSGLIVPGR